MARELKIIVTGPVGAGKTTAIRAIAEGAVVSTEVPMSEGAQGDKQSTTVGLDYAVCALRDGTVLKVFGTPGQERFHAMWDVLATGAFGLIVLADNSRPDPIGDVEHFLRAFEPHVSLRHAVVGVGRVASHPQPGPDEYHRRLDAIGLSVPVIDVDVRRPADVRLLLSILVGLVEVDACLPSA